jgi:hypothetical protein
MCEVLSPKKVFANYFFDKEIIVENNDLATQKVEF